MSFIFEQPQQRLYPRQTAGGEASLADIWGASRDAMIYVDNSLSRGAAVEEAYARRVRAIAEATGETIENPAVEAFRGMPQMDELETMQAGESRYEASKRRFRERLDQLAQSHPAAAEAIGAARPIEDDAIAIAREAEGRLADLSASRDGLGKWTALLGGGVAGAMRDPLQVGLLVLGGGPGAARTVATRLLSAAGKEALINAGGEAVLQPAVQAWREEAGLPSGFGEAMRNIAFSGALGGAFGAAGQGVAEGARALSRSGRAAQLADHLKGRLAPRGEDVISGDPVRISQGLEPIRETLPAQARGALDQVDADAAISAARPAALPADVYDSHVSEAMRAAQTGSAPEFTPDPAQAARVADLLLPAEKAGKTAKPQTLTDFLLETGGVSDHRGELQAIGADQVKRRGKGSLVREGGRTLDDARLIAAEAGYFNDRFGTPEDAMARSTVADFLDLLDEDIRTGRVTVAGAVNADPDNAAARAGIERDIDELQRTIGPGLADEDIAAALKRSAETGETPLDAWATLMERPVDGTISKEIIEPPVPPNKVRVYHSGQAIAADETGRWVSTNRTYASNYRADQPFHYLDLPETDPRVNHPDYPDQGVKQGYTFSFETTADEAKKLRQISRSGDILPGWEDADLDAMAARMNDPASGIDDPARPSQLISDSVDDLDADLADLPADTVIPFDDGTITADQLRDTLERSRHYQNLVEACRA